MIQYGQKHKHVFNHRLCFGHKTKHGFNLEPALTTPVSGEQEHMLGRMKHMFALLGSALLLLHQILASLLKLSGLNRGHAASNSVLSTSSPGRMTNNSRRDETICSATSESLAEPVLTIGDGMVTLTGYLNPSHLSPRREIIEITRLSPFGHLHTSSQQSS